MKDRYFIASLVAQVAPEQLEFACASVKDIPYADVPISNEGGKMVILIDAPNTSELLAATEQIRDISGIYSLLPVYQHEEIFEQKESQTSNLELENTL